MSTSHSEASRAAKHTKARENMMSDFERQKAALLLESERAGKSAGDRFIGKIDSIDEALKKSTVGLVKLEDFQRTRLELEEKKRLESGAETQDPENKAGGKNKKRKDKDRVAGSKKKDNDNKVKGKNKNNILSFQLEDEPQDHDVGKSSGKRRKIDDDNDKNRDDAAVESESFKLSTLKNPNVDTSFLPDRSREEKDRMDRENLRREWLKRQEEMKNEEISITYSWWDGSGHRKVVKVSTREQSFWADLWERLEETVEWRGEGEGEGNSRIEQGREERRRVEKARERTEEHGYRYRKVEKRARR